MKKLALFLFVFAFLGLNAQVLDPVLGPRAWKKENVAQRKAITLTHIREADVMWSTRIWREIDLRQKINHPLYFPLDSAIHGKRSFIQIIYDEFFTNPAAWGPNGIKFYRTSEFEETYTYNELMDIVSKSDTVQKVDDDCNIIDTVMSKPFNDIKPEVTRIKLMEDWFFDKQRSVMDVRILALGLEFPDFSVRNETDPNCEVAVFSEFARVEGSVSEVWMFFPQLRPIMAELECYQRKNDAARLSYDDIFLQRIFSSYIYREENVFNRSIREYTAGLDALLEAEKIKNNMQEFEQDLWQY